MQAARGASLTGDETTQSDHGPRPATPAPRRRRRHLTVFAAVVAVGYAADLGSKELVLARLEPHTGVPVLGDWFGLFLTFNSGAAFSLGTSYTAVLSCVAIAAAVAVLWTARRLGSTGWALGLGFLLAGVLGNLTDRIFRAPGPMRGHVVDFLQLPNFPVFNVADICINIAAGLIILQAFRGLRVDGTRDGEPRRRRRSETGPQAHADPDLDAGPGEGGPAR
jgi:signal peptidase II